MGLWEYVFFELKRSVKDDDHQEEIVTDATAEFRRLSTAYREHIGIESDEESATESGCNYNDSENSFAPLDAGNDSLDTGNDGSLSARELRRVPREFQDDGYAREDSRMSKEEIQERLK